MNRLCLVMVGFSLLPLGCSDNSSSQVVFDGFGYPPRRFVATVLTNGAFTCWTWRGGVKVDVLSGTVRPTTGGAYVVAYREEGRRYTAHLGRYEYDVATNACTVYPNTIKGSTHSMVRGFAFGS